VLRGTAQNPDAFFQAREACNPFYAACPGIVQDVMKKFAKVVDRTVRTLPIRRSPDAERMIMMGSGCEDRARDRRVPHQTGRRWAC
jgi:pyruvate-ferredoxin/flavodoxin oxidoreductase